VGLFVQVPTLRVRVCPESVLPEIAGRVTFAGGDDFVLADPLPAAAIETTAIEARRMSRTMALRAGRVRRLGRRSTDVFIV
jgi:hypothetical protein